MNYISQEMSECYLYPATSLCQRLNSCPTLVTGKNPACKCYGEVKMKSKESIRANWKFGAR